MVPIKASTGIINDCDGSSSWEYGSTNYVICSVSGPMEVRLRAEVTGGATVEVEVIPAKGLSSTRERYLEQKIIGALRSILMAHMNPRSLIHISLQVVQSTDQAMQLTACLNAACLALMDAAIPLSGVIAASCLATSDSEVLQYNDGRVSGIADGAPTATHVVCYRYMPGAPPSIAMCESSGPTTKRLLLACLQKGLESCNATHTELEKAMETKVNKERRWTS